MSAPGTPGLATVGVYLSFELPHPGPGPLGKVLGLCLFALVLAGERVPFSYQLAAAVAIGSACLALWFRDARRQGFERRAPTRGRLLRGLGQAVLLALLWFLFHRRYPPLDPAYFSAYVLGALALVQGALDALGLLAPGAPAEDGAARDAGEVPWKPAEPLMRAVLWIGLPIALAGFLALTWVETAAIETAPPAPTGAFTEELVDGGETFYVTPDTLARIELLEAVLENAVKLTFGALVLLGVLGVVSRRSFWRDLSEGWQSHFGRASP